MKAYGLTHCGMVRKENQDSFEILELSDKALICVVCDGMGGANAGALAGSLACNTFVQYLKVHLKSASQMKKLMLKAVEEANRAVYEKAATDPSYRGMGTTLTAIGIWDKDVCVVNVGDSRVYAVGEAGIECLTVDHSVVELMVQRGEITSEQAKHYPGKNMITRAVGTDASVQSDVFTRQHTQGDAYVLCSDGLSNQLADQELLFEVAHGTSYEDCGERLLQIALSRGAPDNVTMILAYDET
ncbi:MAG: Stp1/IreP family PP2C-type Ser/Thr phosphatase [Ruminococcaceae bacterium]|nr:Stp1/IreP family PP2C-type Ser/Thr phosphatase [Oscillospiraceae bacterium]